MSRFHVDDDDGTITLGLNLTTYSHAAQIESRAKLKLDGVNYPMTREPLETPTNYAYATVNTFNLRFTGTYDISRGTPKRDSLDVTAKLSDGSKARFKEKTDLGPGPDSPSPEQPTC